MTTLDRQGLEEEFNMEPVEPEIVDDERDEFELEWEDSQESVRVIKNNVERANEILDQIQSEMANGNFSARLVEVASQMINSITHAEKVIIDDKNYNKYLDIRKAIVLLKKREVDIKALAKSTPKNQNLIVASREDVLKLLQNPDEKEENSE